MNCKVLGQQYDPETGLYYNRHRYYDPQQGRYITQDPIGLRGGWNAYLYTNNPVRKIDPLGLSGWDSFGEFVNQPGVQSEITKAMPNNSEATTPVSLRPDGNPWGYGCGDESTDKYVPDSLFGVDFMPACIIHDRCYGTLGSDKKFCDKQFGDNIGLACDKALKTPSGFEDTLSDCYTVAGIYQLAVEQLGEGAFKTAQEAAAEVTNAK